MEKIISTCLFGLSLMLATATITPAETPKGEISGSAWVHSPESLLGVVENADVALPAKLTGGPVFFGKYKDLPKLTEAKVPVVVFLHGSSGLKLKAIGEWQQWLASEGYASVAPDSFALPDHVMYTSPVDKDSYEKIHALRASEIAPVVAALKKTTWADPTRLILAGTSEGSIPVARYAGNDFAARMIFSWSCENNYFVLAPSTFVGDKPVLNINSDADKYFSKANSWLGNPEAIGNCSVAFKDNAKAAVLLLPGAPHTLINLPAARYGVLGFLRENLGN